MLVASKPGQASSVLLSLLLVLAPSRSGAASEEAGDPSTAAAGAIEEPTGFPPNWLSWSPPPECPTQEYIEGRIREWLGGGLPASAQLEVSARLTWVDSGRWDVHVLARLNGREGLRHITVEHCSEAADFVALAVVLAVNPDFAPPPVSDSSSAAPRTDAAALSPFGSSSAEEPGVAEPAVTEPAQRRLTALGPAASPKKVPLFLSFGVRGELDLGTFPTARGGLAIDGAVSWPHWFLSLSGALYPAVEEELAGASGPIAFSLLVGRARGCYLFGRSSVRLGPCLSAELGAMQAGQTSGHVEPPAATELWSAVAAGLQGQVAVLPWLAPFATLDAAFPLTRPRFVLEDGTLVHQPSVVALACAVGIRFFLHVR
jgi:hypothetical protein